MAEARSKLQMTCGRIVIPADRAIGLAIAIFGKIGCSETTARQIAHHLADSDLSGVESHGLMRTLQYCEQFRTGYISPSATPEFRVTERGIAEVDGRGGIGIPAMYLAYERGMALARETAVSALAVRNVGHTGRHGAYAELAAKAGFLTVMLGGGNRRNWRQVAPHGGAKAILPTNPYCIGIPGGERGPVVIDFATSKIAGGWIYAARSAGALLPEGCLIDRHGNPSRDPEAYFNGGAILPAGGHKGYALALVADLVAEAMLGPCTTECNWLLITLDTARFREQTAIQATAEEILDELRNCPPGSGFERVEVPGERERDHREASGGKIALPEKTWMQILALARELDAV